MNWRKKEKDRTSDILNFMSKLDKKDKVKDSDEVKRAKKVLVETFWLAYGTMFENDDGECVAQFSGMNKNEGYKVIIDVQKKGRN